MIHYMILAPDNRLLERGSVSDEADLPVDIGGNRLERVQPDDSRQPYRLPTTYADQRAMAYPSVGSQLDMLWHAMDEGAMPVIEPWYSTVKAVKDQYPKPEAA